jgi:hypothetical protein
MDIPLMPIIIAICCGCIDPVMPIIICGAIICI